MGITEDDITQSIKAIQNKLSEIQVNNAQATTHIGLLMDTTGSMASSITAVLQQTADLLTFSKVLNFEITIVEYKDADTVPPIIIHNTDFEKNISHMSAYGGGIHGEEFGQIAVHLLHNIHMKKFKHNYAKIPLIMINISDEKIRPIQSTRNCKCKYCDQCIQDLWAHSLGYNTEYTTLLEENKYCCMLNLQITTRRDTRDKILMHTKLPYLLTELVMPCNIINATLQFFWFVCMFRLNSDARKNYKRFEKELVHTSTYVDYLDQFYIFKKTKIDSFRTYKISYADNNIDDCITNCTEFRTLLLKLFSSDTTSEILFPFLKVFYPYVKNHPLTKTQAQLYFGRPNSAIKKIKNEYFNISCTPTHLCLDCLEVEAELPIDHMWYYYTPNPITIESFEMLISEDEFIRLERALSTVQYINRKPKNVKGNQIRKAINEDGNLDPLKAVELISHKRITPQSRQHQLVCLLVQKIHNVQIPIDFEKLLFTEGTTLHPLIGNWYYCNFLQQFPNMPDQYKTILSNMMDMIQKKWKFCFNTTISYNIENYYYALASTNGFLYCQHCSDVHASGYYNKGLAVQQQVSNYQEYQNYKSYCSRMHCPYALYGTKKDMDNTYRRFFCCSICSKLYYVERLNRKVINGEMEPKCPDCVNEDTYYCTKHNHIFWGNYISCPLCDNDHQKVILTNNRLNTKIKFGDLLNSEQRKSLIDINYNGTVKSSDDAIASPYKMYKKLQINMTIANSDIFWVQPHTNIKIPVNFVDQLDKIRNVAVTTIFRDLTNNVETSCAVCYEVKNLKSVCKWCNSYICSVCLTKLIDQKILYLTNANCSISSSKWAVMQCIKCRNPFDWKKYYRYGKNLSVAASSNMAVKLCSTCKDVFVYMPIIQNTCCIIADNDTEELLQIQCSSCVAKQQQQPQPQITGTNNIIPLIRFIGNYENDIPNIASKYSQDDHFLVNDMRSTTTKPVSLTYQKMMEYLHNTVNAYEYRNKIPTTQTCPVCSRHIIKLGDCNDMSCFCGQTFCWICKRLHCNSHKSDYSGDYETCFQVVHEGLALVRLYLNIKEDGDSSDYESDY
ncbi:hypothetical protein HgNV_062 [Homarus gammarus nudivirus]|uniref:Uncharacterized protein n=1 Tax=Homarus gammarus nudivirus TaxID=2509616 RepID=A0A411HBA6_9VIRU|nr:hypothetical protein KM727_gp62 [Homarus gammarus nudivirus]QBB28667.1 hypothetical protein HgNV_062 [Homarus gammarus nudivirus]